MARLVIEPIGLHWINIENPSADLCAHGGVRVVFEGHEVFRTSDNSQTISIAALYLLRHVETDHLNTDADHLIPHCAFEMLVVDGSVVNISGCGSGEDWRITHGAHLVTLQFWNGPTVEVSDEEWKNAVLKFSSHVRDFYFGDEKKPGEGDAEWFKAFKGEWSQRHESLSEA